MTDAHAGAGEPKKGNGLLKLLLLGCLGCGCLFFAFLAAVIGIPFMITAPAVDAARGHLALASSDPARSWGECSSAMKAATSEAAFKDFVAAHPEYYKATDVTFNNRSFENGLCKLTGTATSASGTSSLRVDLVKEGETWRVQYVGPDTP